MLINSINEKDCVVEIEFTIGKTEYKVVRAMKPNKFEIYHNGVLWDKESSVNEQQKNFENSVLKMNYKSFTQIVGVRIIYVRTIYEVVCSTETRDNRRYTRHTSILYYESVTKRQSERKQCRDT